jgi:hypothetical protein
MKYCVSAFVAFQCCFSFSVSGQPATITADTQRYLKNLLHAAQPFDTAGVSHAEESSPAPEDRQALWKQWRLVENYQFGKNRGSLPMIADLQALHPFFREKIIELTRLCQQAGITLAIVESYRTHAKQSEYYAMGKAYTATPGGKSRHQYGLAVDIVPVVDSVAVWNSPKLWRKIGLLGERLGLTWGGRWRVLYDPGHFEWSGGVSRYDLAKGKLPRIPAAFSSRYESLAEELTMLQIYWKAWEAEQSVMATRRTSLDNLQEVPAGVGN